MASSSMKCPSCLESCNELVEGVCWDCSHELQSSDPEFLDRLRVEAEESLSAPLLEDLRMEQEDESRMEGMFALSCYMHNATAVKFAEDIFPGRHPDYLGEWVERWLKSPAVAFARLDFGNTQKLFTIAWERHGHAAEEYFRVNREFERSNRG